MTKSSATPKPTKPTEPVAPKPRSQRSWTLFVFIFRLLLLGVGGTVALLLGVAIAQFYPSRSTETPWIEQGRQRSQAFLTGLKQFPQPWNSSPSPAATASSSPISSANSPGANSPAANVPSPLSSPERQQLQTELTQLQKEAQALSDRTRQLETRIGSSNPSGSLGPLDERLRSLEQALSGNATLTDPNNQTPSQTPAVVPSSTTTAAGALMVTLPSDTLFTEDGKGLRPGTEAILDSIIGDLSRYPGATIRIVGHTDDSGTADAARVRTFEQAKAIAHYLSGKLGDGYRWVVVGSGSSHPLVDNSTAANQQRNRRIEMVIDPP